MRDAQLRHRGLKYAEAHATQLPLVMVARVGREVGLVSPLGELRIEWYVNHRPYTPAEIGLFAFYVLAIAGVYGAIALRRKHVTIWPFLGISLGIVVTAMLTFGETRYRVPLDVVLVVLGAVGFDSLLRFLPRRSKSTHHVKDIVVTDVGTP